MSSNEKLTKSIHSDPIPIAAGNRPRSVSVSSASSGSASSSSPTTPASPSFSSQRIPSPSASPILSYFLAQSPTKTPGTAATTFPFKRKFGNTNAVFEVDEEIEKEIPVAAHARRASATVANRFSQSPIVPFSDAQTERGTNVLRRLSLSNAFIKPPLDTATRIVSPPSAPPNTAVSPTSKTAPFTVKPHRSATISTDGGKPRRAPSPMGERILKGHFDGFN